MDIKNLALAIVVGAGMATTLPAAAGHEQGPEAETRGRFGVARVIDVDPIVRVVRVSEPRRSCWDEDYIVRNSPRGRSGTAGSAILGGIIGGAIGNAFGDGRGRDAATVAGVLVGSAIGHDRAESHNDRYHASADAVRTRTRCDVQDQWREEERIEGYDVTYEYLGERYRTRMSHDPGETLKVWVSVRPVSE